jgi:sulfur-carrier protein
VARLSSRRPPNKGIVTIRFWAAARQAVGHGEETSQATTIAALREELGLRPELSNVLKMASFLVDGVRADDDTVIPPGCVVDVLPPFAGG